MTCVQQHSVTSATQRKPCNCLDPADIVTSLGEGILGRGGLKPLPSLSNNEVDAAVVNERICANGLALYRGLR